jgi:hypothetical protein
MELKKNIASSFYSHMFLPYSRFRVSQRIKFNVYLFLQLETHGRAVGAIKSKIDEIKK